MIRLDEDDNKNKEIIFSAIQELDKAQEHITVKILVDKTMFSDQTVAKYLAILEAEGRIERKDIGGMYLINLKGK